MFVSKYPSKTHIITFLKIKKKNKIWKEFQTKKINFKKAECIYFTAYLGVGTTLTCSRHGK